MILPIVSHTPAFDASDLPNVSPQLCEASSVVERAKKTGQNVHLLYNTTLTLASVNATTVTSVNLKGKFGGKMNFTYVLGFVVLRDVVKVFPVSSSSFSRKTIRRNRARNHSGA